MVRTRAGTKVSFKVRRSRIGFREAVTVCMSGFASTNPETLRKRWESFYTVCVRVSSKRRVSQTDGLGRLASICEVSTATLMGQNGAPSPCGQDIAQTGFLTSYVYDDLNNLTQVTQGTMAPRMFAYDSLSRLTSASNPESGTVTYAYDANGNLSTKKDARNITTTFTYDALNRNTQKSYSDGTPAHRHLYL